MEARQNGWYRNHSFSQPFFENTDDNLDAWPATPDANCLFERIDVRLGGNLIEPVTESARCNELFTRLTMSPQKKLNYAQMRFGTAVSATSPEWDSAQLHIATQVLATGKKTYVEM